MLSSESLRFQLQRASRRAAASVSGDSKRSNGNVSPQHTLDALFAARKNSTDVVQTNKTRVNTKTCIDCEGREYYDDNLEHHGLRLTPFPTFAIGKRIYVKSTQPSFADEAD